MSKIISKQGLLDVSGITLLTPTWPEIPNVRAYTTTRIGGVSEAPFDRLNLGLSSGDNRAHVLENRSRLFDALEVPGTVCYLNQIHSNIAVRIDERLIGVGADASITAKPHEVSYILTADCLPILVAHREGKEVAGIHAGWKSLLTNMIEETLALAQFPLDEYYIWLGPAISQQAFEIGQEVRMSLELRERQLGISSRHSDHQTIFRPSPSEVEGRVFADIYQLAKNRLTHLGIPSEHIFGGDFCTYSDRELFHSYRRDGNQSGRMASLIWIEP